MSGEHRGIPFSGLWVALALAGGLLPAALVHAQQGDSGGGASAAAAPGTSSHRVSVLPVAPGIDMLTVDGVNVAVQSGEDGTVVVDTGPAAGAEALHSYAGFTTGHWEGDTLVTESTHLKDSFLERNGAPASNQETVRLFWTRHGDELMVLGIMRDPVYLETPWPIAQTFRLVTGGSADIVPEFCEDAEVVEGFSDGYHSATVLPDQLPAAQHYMQKHYNIPLEASQGGAATMYPEFTKRLASSYKTPTTYCTQYCCTGRNAAQFCKNVNN